MHKKVSLVLVIALAAVWLLATPVVSNAENVVKIGVVDLQQVINRSQKGKAAKEMLRKKFERMRQELDMRRSEIEKSKTELEAQRSVLDPQVLYDKQKTLKRKMRDFDDQFRDMQDVMKREEMQSTVPILKGIRDVISKIGKEQGYTIIIEGVKSLILYAPEGIKITEEVIRKYDAAK